MHNLNYAAFKNNNLNTSETTVLALLAINRTCICYYILFHDDISSIQAMKQLVSKYGSYTVYIWAFTSPLYREIRDISSWPCEHQLNVRNHVCTRVNERVFRWWLHTSEHTWVHALACTRARFLLQKEWSSILFQWWKWCAFIWVLRHGYHVVTTWARFTFTWCAHVVTTSVCTPDKPTLIRFARCAVQIIINVYRNLHAVHYKFNYAFLNFLVFFWGTQGWNLLSL